MGELLLRQGPPRGCPQSNIKQTRRVPDATYLMPFSTSAASALEGVCSSTVDEPSRHQVQGTASRRVRKTMSLVLATGQELRSASACNQRTAVGCRRNSYRATRETVSLRITRMRETSGNSDVPRCSCDVHWSYTLAVQNRSFYPAVFQKGSFLRAIYGEVVLGSQRQTAVAYDGQPEHLRVRVSVTAARSGETRRKEWRRRNRRAIRHLSPWSIAS